MAQQQSDGLADASSGQEQGEGKQGSARQNLQVRSVQPQASGQIGDIPQEMMYPPGVPVQQMLMMSGDLPLPPPPNDQPPTAKGPASEKLFAVSEDESIVANPPEEREVSLTGPPGGSRAEPSTHPPAHPSSQPPVLPQAQSSSQPPVLPQAQLSSQPQTVELPSDLIDYLAGELFEEDRIQDGMDSIIKYMCVANSFKDSVLRQFRQMENVVFSIAPLRDGTLHTSAQFYRERAQEGRPFRVSQRVLGYLLQDHLRVKHIVFEWSLVERIGSRGMLSALELCRMSATDILIVLLGLEQTNPGVPQTQLSPLQLDCVEVIIGGPSTEEGLNRFIAMAPKKLVIKLENRVPVRGVSERLQLLAIETVRVEVDNMSKDEDAWPTFLPFLTASCPDLRRLDVSCTLTGTEHDHGWQFGDWIVRLVDSLRDDIFPTLVCNADAVVKFEMTVRLTMFQADELFNDPERGGHPVLQLGVLVQQDAFSMSRSIVVQREGRQQAPWSILFHIDGF